MKMNKKEIILKEISKIPRGSLMTYKEIAVKTNSNPRYVGYVCSQNRDYENIPCHRVVRSDGKIGGYNKGVKKKEKLLREEGIVIINGRIKHQ